MASPDRKNVWNDPRVSRRALVGGAVGMGLGTVVGGGGAILKDITRNRAEDEVDRVWPDAPAERQVHQAADQLDAAQAEISHAIPELLKPETSAAALQKIVTLSRSPKVTDANHVLALGVKRDQQVNTLAEQNGATIYEAAAGYGAIGMLASAVVLGLALGGRKKPVPSSAALNGNGALSPA